VCRQCVMGGMSRDQRAQGINSRTAPHANALMMLLLLAVVTNSSRRSLCRLSTVTVPGCNLPSCKSKPLHQSCKDYEVPAALSH
jgi:hypothetical protein